MPPGSYNFNKLSEDKFIKLQKNPDDFAKSCFYVSYSGEMWDLIRLKAFWGFCLLGVECDLENLISDAETKFKEIIRERLQEGKRFTKGKFVRYLEVCMEGTITIKGGKILKKAGICESIWNKVKPIEVIERPSRFSDYDEDESTTDIIETIKDPKQNPEEEINKNKLYPILIECFKNLKERNITHYRICTIYIQNSEEKNIEDIVSIINEVLKNYTYNNVRQIIHRAREFMRNCVKKKNKNVYEQYNHIIGGSNEKDK